MFGKYSDMIHDYTARGLVPIPKTDEAVKLWKMIDPYFYRDKLKMPKLIVNGANDPYWATDALNLYWDELENPKWVLYVPNAGHDLQQKKMKAGMERSRVLDTLAVFARAQVFDKELPKLTWKHDDNSGKFRLTVTSNVKPVAARMWVAKATTKDFRKAEWVEQAMVLDGGSAVGEIAPPAAGNIAMFGEVEFTMEGLTYYLSTQVRIGGKGGAEVDTR